MADSEDIARVTFVHTVRWPNIGVTDSLTPSMWQSFLITPYGMEFVHTGGYTLMVPWANIRWAQGMQKELVTDVSGTSATPSEESFEDEQLNDTEAAIALKRLQANKEASKPEHIKISGPKPRGRPRKVILPT